MLKTHNQATLQDENKKNDVDFEINPQEHPDHIKIKMNGNEAIVKIPELYNLVFTLVDSEKKAEMLPERQTSIVNYVRKITLIAKKDIKKGDPIETYVNISVPKVVVEGYLKEHEKYILDQIKENKK